MVILWASHVTMSMLGHICMGRGLVKHISFLPSSWSPGHKKSHPINSTSSSACTGAWSIGLIFTCFQFRGLRNSNHQNLLSLVPLHLLCSMTFNMDSLNAFTNYRYWTETSTSTFKTMWLHMSTEHWKFNSTLKMQYHKFKHHDESSSFLRWEKINVT